MRLLFAALWFVLAAVAATAQTKLALVVGNAAYETAPTLRNPVNDAREIAGSLERIGFEVLLGLDQNTDELRDLIRTFGIRADGAELVLFYYAGHGIQVSGRNYLVPVDAVLDHEADLDFAAIDLQLILKQLERTGANRVILLDACRDNPFESRLSRAMGQSRSAASLSRGLAPIETDGGAFIGFATDPGEVAFDGAGIHSPFTEALLRHIETPGLEINAMMTRVRADVFAGTDRLQRPWSSSSLLDDLFLARPETTPESDGLLDEVRAWRAADADGDASAFAAFLDEFPSGVFADQARRKLSELEGQSEVALALVPAVPPTDEQSLALRLVEPRDGQVVPRAKPAVLPSPQPRLVPPQSADCVICPRMVQIPGGVFRMGSDKEAAERPVTDVSLPAHQVSYSEITVGEFQRFLDTTGYRQGKGCYIWTPEGRMRFRDKASFRDPGYPIDESSPAACVSWIDAEAYVAWLNAETYGRFRIPSEAELEYSIRAGSEAEYPWAGGLKAACAHVNAADAGSRFRWRNAACDDGYDTIASPGAFPDNAFGLDGTSGNLWEWAADCWNGSHRGALSDGSARLDGNCESRVLRGASWDDPVENLRSAYRVGIPAKRRQANVGFRVVRDNR